MEVMPFGCALHQILQQVLVADTRLVLVYISKVDLPDLYMRLLARIEELLSVTFLIPKKTPSDQQMVRFHLSHTMWYVASNPYF